MSDATPVPSLGVVLDCADPEPLARFWAEALHYRVLGWVDNYTQLVAPDGREGPELLLQRVSEPKRSKNRMHFDLHTPDIEAEATRLEALGARRLADEPVSEHGSTWIQMADPEGNEFCVCDSSGSC